MEEIQKQELTSMDIKEAQLQKLKELFPEAFTEGLKVDWDKLRLTLGDETVDTGKERYGMNWPGKADCFKTIQQPSIGTLVPARDESIDFDTTQNLFIEGDNLEVLKLLQKSYLGKIKMICIDPPYNTGNDFIYPDNYSENLDTYLEYTGQIDGEGRKFATNTETDGRFHSKWMNMMYPRLFLAKNLLREDGLIFISIDDSEVDNLKKLCNEIFGEENFIGCIVRTTGQTTGQDSEGLGSSFDYLLVYSKYPDRGLNGLPLTEHDLKRFENEDEKGKYAYDQMRKTGSNDKREDRPNMYYAIKDPDNNDIYPIGPGGYESCWRFERKTYDKLSGEGYILWKKTKRDNAEVWWPYVKYYLEGRTKRPSPLWNDLEGNKKAARDLRAIFDGKKIFDFPKPIELLQRTIAISCEKDDIVLDFFAGSASLAHAVLEYNQREKWNVKFICIQLPQVTEESSEAYKEGYKTISEISKERIRRVSKKIKAEYEKQVKKEKDSLFQDSNNSNSKIDIGFKVLKLQKSNFKVWDTTLEKEPDIIQQKLFEHIQHISPEAQQEAILYELLLKSGFELTTPIEGLTLAGKPVFSIADGQLLICLEKEITHDCIKAMAEKEPSRVICLDEAFTGTNADALKTNAVQIMKSKGVVNFRTV
jgi:adenine-specific DNA-methyltransferase